MSDTVQRAREALNNAAAAAAMDELRAAADDRETRRELRRPRGAAGYGPPRCGGCQRWLASTRQQCACGFNNDVRRTRNLGGYSG